MTKEFDYNAVSAYMGWICSMCNKSLSPKLDQCKYCNGENPQTNQKIPNYKYGEPVPIPNTMLL